VIAGGSGFIGRTLVERLVQRNIACIILTRNTPSGRPSDARNTNSLLVREVSWNLKTPGEWWHALEGASALINLAGRTVDCRPTPENLAEILTSRVDATRVLGEALRRCKVPPEVWVQASTLAGYADLGDRYVDETAPKGQGQLAEVCHRWEAAMESARLPNMRAVVLRIGMVLGSDGGALAALARLARLGMGGAAGSGRQYMSWIHRIDMADLLCEAASNPNFKGPYNACAPNPSTNAEFMKELRRVLDRPWCPNAPEFAVRLGAWFMGTNPELALSGWRGIPKKALEAGFRFTYPELRGALENLLTPEKVTSKK